MINFKRSLHNFFIPHEENNYRSNALHLNMLTGYLLVAIVLSSFYKPITTFGRNVLGVATDITITRLLELTNKERTQAGLPPLQYNNKLAAAAANKGQNMFAHNYWAHYGPDGATPWDFILGAGYQYQYAGENLAKDFLISDEVVKAWMDSPTHRDNIMKKEYNEIGFAVMNGSINGEETTLVVQMFGTPLANTVAAAEPAGQAKPAQIVPTTIPSIAVSPVTKPQQQVLSEEKSSSIVIKTKEHTTPLFFFNGLTVKLSFLFFLVLMTALVFDLYYAQKLNIIRLTGKHIAHVMFIGFILIAITLISKGNIL